MASIEIDPDGVEHVIHNVWSRYQQVQAAEAQLDSHMHSLSDLLSHVPAAQNAVGNFRAARHTVVKRSLHVVDTGADKVISQVADLIKRDVDAAIKEQ